MTPLLQLQGISRFFGKPGRLVRAVENVSLDVNRGEVLGLVGESGSGKSTIGRLALRLIAPSAGRIHFDGEDITDLPERRMKPFRRRAQMVFQDPFASLNPRFRVEEIIGEAINTHALARGAARTARIRDLLDLVGLPSSAMDRYPHEFSGGQRQRIGIARALAVEPSLIVADEPVSALDVSVQAQVLNLLQDLRARLDLAILFISHDLDVVELMCDRIAVLYLGRVMEIGPARLVAHHAAHPYTRALISAAPVADPDAVSQRQILKGDIPSPLNPPTGCVFRTRCPHATELCASAVPALKEMTAGHAMACHYQL